MLNYVILDSLSNIIDVFCVCDNMSESIFQHEEKSLWQIACVFYVYDNMGESKFQYPNKPLE